MCIRDRSTLVNLIPRFYDVTEGKITLDGEDIRDITQHDLRDQLGYVPQKGILFSGDIASNILYGNPDGSEEDMKEAASIAQATEFIEAKKKKYQSSISQGGSNVSGGQKPVSYTHLDYQVSPEYLRLEITESAYTDNPQQLLDTIEILREYGFEILMDDFGSGYSSLNMLKEVPVDILKLSLIHI